MRYRIDKYNTSVTGGALLTISFDVEKKIYDSLPDTEVSGETSPGITLKTAITEAVRLIADETQGGYVVMSTGQKLVVNTATKTSTTVGEETTYEIIITFLKSTLIAAATEDGEVDEDDESAINAIFSASPLNDMFTIAVDWGDNLVEIDEKIGDLDDIIEAINGDTVANIVADYCSEMFDSMFVQNEDGISTYTLVLPMDTTIEETPNGYVATL